MVTVWGAIYRTVYAPSLKGQSSFGWYVVSAVVVLLGAATSWGALISLTSRVYIVQNTSVLLTAGKALSSPVFCRATQGDSRRLRGRFFAIVAASVDGMFISDFAE
ncbi:hypothetical protein KCP77_16310 [Salmonella enterica subsp. enterica]|nr:hypothetical protein KCP77_16310 [Salmonella enterica subsp. enterica]